MDKYNSDSIYENEELEKGITRDNNNKDKNIESGGADGDAKSNHSTDNIGNIDFNFNEINKNKKLADYSIETPEEAGDINKKSPKAAKNLDKETEKISKESQKELNKWSQKHKIDEKNRWNEKHRPEEKLKKWIGYSILGGLIILVSYAFIRVSFPKKEVIKNPKEQEQSNENRNTAKAGINMLDSDINSYKGYSDEKQKKISENIPHEHDNSSEISDDIGNNYETNNKNSEDDLLKELIIQEIKDEMTARHSNLTFDNSNANSNNGNNSSNDSERNKNNYADNSNDSRKIAYPDDPNYQLQKKEFLTSDDGKDNYNKYSEQEAFSPFELKAGSIIPGILITGINSDLPGTILAIVREDVYDSVTGNNLLIPKGTKIKGTYDSGISYGQSRILIVWQRLIFSDGKSLNLDKFAGVDMSGYAGMTGKVDNHSYDLFKAVVLSSMLGAGSSIIANNNSKDDDNWRNSAGAGAGEQVMNIGSNISNKVLGIQPTIVISQGERFNIIVESDLILTPYKRR